MVMLRRASRKARQERKGSKNDVGSALCGDKSSRRLHATTLCVLCVRHDGIVPPSPTFLGLERIIHKPAATISEREAKIPGFEATIFGPRDKFYAS
jgi:hypothetical protein